MEKIAQEGKKGEEILSEIATEKVFFVFVWERRQTREIRAAEENPPPWFKQTAAAATAGSQCTPLLSITRRTRTNHVFVCLCCHNSTHLLQIQMKISIDDVIFKDAPETGLLKLFVWKWPKNAFSAERHWNNMKETGWFNCPTFIRRVFAAWGSRRAEARPVGLGYRSWETLCRARAAHRGVGGRLSRCVSGKLPWQWWTGSLGLTGTWTLTKPWLRTLLEHKCSKVLKCFLGLIYSLKSANVYLFSYNTLTLVM